MSNTYNIHIQDAAGPVTLFSRLDNVVQHVQTSKTLSEDEAAKLSALVSELRQALQKTPPEGAADAQVLAEQAEELITEFEKPTRRPTALKIRARGLLEAAQAIQGIVPAAFDVAQKIAAFIVPA